METSAFGKGMTINDGVGRGNWGEKRLVPGEGQFKRKFWGPVFARNYVCNFIRNYERNYIWT